MSLTGCSPRTSRRVVDMIVGARQRRQMTSVEPLRAPSPSRPAFPRPSRAWPLAPATRTGSPSARPSGGATMTRSSAESPEASSMSLAEIARDRHGLEQDLVVGTDGRNAQAALVEDQRARRNMQRHGVALQAEADIGIAARHQFAVGVVERELHPRRARTDVDRLRGGLDRRQRRSGSGYSGTEMTALAPILIAGT